MGDTITFTWRFAGIGSERCFHDGMELAECASPMQVEANDVSSGSTQHTFRVEFEVSRQCMVEWRTSTSAAAPRQPN